jgi:SPP1 gp7 family putative phage head morphogenesis protein
MGLRQRAEVIARSELANAYVKGAIDHNLKQGYAFIRWVAATDERACRWCLSRHGQIFPADQVVIPAHPQCRCTPVPVPANEVLEEDAVIRDTLLDGEFWREEQAAGLRALAKAEGISEEKARGLLQRALTTPTASERYLFPDRKRSIQPSAPLDAPMDGRTFSEAIGELAARRAAARG